MACRTIETRNNFVRWDKVQGTLTLAQLQAEGLPPLCVVTPPTTPQNLTATLRVNNTVDIAWQDVSADETGFELFRSTDNVNFSLLVSLGQDVESYNDTTVVGNTTYYYKIRAINVDEKSDFSNVATITTQLAFSGSWTTTNTSTGSSNSDQVKLPLISSGTYNFVVRWGDGNEDTITTWNQAETTHTYSSTGTYTISIVGTIQGWSFNNTGDRLKITSITSWGIFYLNDTAFYGCSNLVISATDSPTVNGATLNSAFRDCAATVAIGDETGYDVSGVTVFQRMFQGCTVLDVDLSSWDMMAATDISSMFVNCAAFNSTIPWTTTTSLTAINGIFFGCSSFNQALPNLVTSNCSSFAQMFEGATIFNQSINNLDTSSNTSLQNTFRNASAYNQSMASWDVSGVTRMDGTFQGATAFNGDITTWTPSASLTNMQFTFDAATNFNQNISGWTVSGVTNFVGTFRDAAAFNQDISVWTVSAALAMNSMFRGASAFDQPIGAWGADTSGVTTFSNMFQDATSFDQDIGGLDVTALTAANLMFDGVTLSTANYDALLVGWEAQAVQNNVTFDGGNSTYTSAGAGGTARAALIADHSWTITDGGGV